MIKQEEVAFFGGHMTTMKTTIDSEGKGDDGTSLQGGDSARTEQPQQQQQQQQQEQSQLATTISPNHHPPLTTRSRRRRRSDDDDDSEARRQAPMSTTRTITTTTNDDNNNDNNGETATTTATTSCRRLPSWRRRRRSTTTTTNSATPTTTTATATTTTTNIHTNKLLLAQELQSHLEQASLALVETLVEHLASSSTRSSSRSSSSRSNNSNNNLTTTTKGLSLPAAAVGWLSFQQLFPPRNQVDTAVVEEEEKEQHERASSPVGVVVDDALQQQQQQPQQSPSFRTTMTTTTMTCSITPTVRQRLLRVLPLATHVRLTAEEWPPLVLPDGSAGGRETATIRTRRRQRNLQQRLREALYENEVAAGNETNNNDDNHHLAIAANNNFLNYYHALTQRPQIDMRIFPACRVLLLDQVPPNRIQNLYVLQNTLEVLRIERSSLDYTDDGCLTTLFAAPFRDNSMDSAPSRQQQQQDPLATTTRPCVVYSKLTHVKIAHCSLTGRMTAAPRNHTASAAAARGGEKHKSTLLWTTYLPNLQCLCLAHNQLSSGRTALAGLSQLPRLYKLDLSYNYLTSLRKAHYRLGNIQTLLLSHNQFTTAEGIDRLYALQTLWLDHNCIADLAAISGLARLPELQSLRLEGNPLEKQFKQQQQQQQQAQRRDKRRNSLLLSSLYRIQVFDLFRQRRPLPPAATYRDLQTILPNLDDKPASLAEMKILKEQTFLAPILQPQQQQQQQQDTAAGTVATATTVIDVSIEAGICERPLSSGLVVPRRPVTQRTRQRRQAHMDQPIHYVAVDPLVPQDSTTTTNSSSDLAAAAAAATTTTDFTLRDVLESLCEMEEEEEEKSLEHDEDLQSVENNQRKEEAADVAENREAESSHANEKLLEGEEKAREDESVEENDFLCREDSDERIAKMDKLPPLPSADLVEEKISDQGQKLVDGLVTKVDEQEEEKKEPAGFEGLSISPIRANDDQRRPSLTTSSGEKETLFETDTPGRDVQSLPGTSVATDTSIDLPTFNGITPPFARRHVSDVSETPSNTSPARLPISLSGIMSSDEHSSLHSSNGTPLRDDASNLRRYQLAEENSTFEGPEAYKNVRVHQDLELYFRLFVFPPWKEDEQSTSAEGDEEPEWRFVLQRFPRIQLWPIDRRLWDQADRDTPNFGSPEEFRRIWKEKVVACGKSALRRLTPNRGARFGFHGELLWADADSSRLKLETVAECRQVILCCSNKSLYFVLDHDKVTVKSREQKRKFPLPVPVEARFKDAIWPHALARHPFSTLRLITIGFGFQRLTLRFGKSATPSEEDFTYILLTSSKVATISLLKEFQDLSHDCRTAADRFALPKDGLLIDNDDRHVLDALGIAVAPDVLGVVLHYQILEQRWRRGERGNVRRVCVVTDAKIYLLDEDYVGDGSASYEAGARQLGESAYRLVDSAPLSLVGQVQAADADPNAITIVIRAASRFQRSHNWRLLCRDRHGAERLVEDVRRAIS